jgi:hypothetical protein
MTNYVAPLLSLFLLASAASADTQVLATVDGTEIQRADVEKLIRPQLIELDNNRYQVMRGALENLIASELLDKEAEARGITRAELEESEVTSKLTSPSEEEVTELFEANKAQLGGATLEDVHDRIVDFLRQQQHSSCRCAKSSRRQSASRYRASKLVMRAVLRAVADRMLRFRSSRSLTTSARTAGWPKLRWSRSLISTAIN